MKGYESKSKHAYKMLTRLKACLSNCIHWAFFRQTTHFGAKNGILEIFPLLEIRQKTTPLQRVDEWRSRKKTLYLTKKNMM